MDVVGLYTVFLQDTTSSGGGKPVFGRGRLDEAPVAGRALYLMIKDDDDGVSLLHPHYLCRVRMRADADELRSAEARPYEPFVFARRLRTKTERYDIWGLPYPRDYIRRVLSTLGYCDADDNGIMFQDALRDEPFWMCVACILVNRTSWSVVRNLFGELRRTYPSPAALMTAPDLTERLSSLGLGNVRALRLRKFALTWMQRGAPDSVATLREYPGCGEYLAHSWSIFMDGIVPEGVEDGKLSEWLQDWASKEELMAQAYAVATDGGRVFAFESNADANAFCFDEDGYIVVESPSDLEVLALEVLVMLWNASGEDEVESFSSRREAAERVFGVMTAVSEKTKGKKGGKTPKANSTGEKVGRRKTAYTGKIVILVEGNPRRAGTKKHENFETLRKLAGQKTGTAERAIEAGIPTGELRKSIDKGWIKLEPVTETS